MSRRSLFQNNLNTILMFIVLGTLCLVVAKSTENNERLSQTQPITTTEQILKTNVLYTLGDKMPSFSGLFTHSRVLALLCRPGAKRIKKRLVSAKPGLA